MAVHNQLSLDKVQYLKNATAEKKIKEEKLASLNQKYKKVGAELEENKSGCIKIQDTIYPEFFPFFFLSLEYKNPLFPFSFASYRYCLFSVSFVGMV